MLRAKALRASTCGRPAKDQVSWLTALTPQLPRVAEFALFISNKLQTNQHFAGNYSAQSAIKDIANMISTTTLIHRLPTAQIAAACALCCAAALHGATANALISAADQRNLQVVASNAVTANRNQRIALVIGNANYKEAPLLNPVNDARAIGKALQDSGFTVILRENTDQRGMMSALREFGDKLRSGGVGIFYYAGHGMQIKGRNYLIPVGANVEREDEVAYSAVDAQAVLDKMEAAGNASNIMILDACRNNPFTRSTRSGQAGLAQMDAPVGTLVAFATSPGAVASDGAGANGLYTQHLLEAMRKPGLKVEDVFKQVRANVRRDSQGKQVPWEATSLEGDFYFKPGAVGGEQSTAARLVATEAQIEVALWDAVKNSTLAIELRAYLNRYPQGRFAEEARGKVALLQAPVVAAALPVATPARPAPAPASTPAATKFRWNAKAGDSWEFINEDVLTGKRVEFKQTVDSVAANGDVSMNNGALIVSTFGDWRYIRNMSNGVATRERSYVGDQKNVPSELRIGFKDSMAYSIDNSYLDGRKFRVEVKGNVEVIGRERVDTPAGAMLAWKTKRELLANSEGKDYKTVTTMWFVPEINRVVAQEFTETNIKTGSTTQHERVSLKAFRLVDTQAQQSAAANMREAGTMLAATDFAQQTKAQTALQAALDQRTDELLKQLAATMPGTQSSPLATAPTAATRPSAASNSFGFTVGDRWRYQTVDRFKKEVVDNWSRQIESIQADGSLRLNGGRVAWSSKGGIQRLDGTTGRTRIFSPDFQYVPDQLRDGWQQPIKHTLTWRNEDGQNGVEEREGKLKVLGRERVTVPAGSFDAWKIEMSGDGKGKNLVSNSNYYVTFKEVWWYAPELRNFVAAEYEQRSNGRIESYTRNELTSFSVRGADEALARR